MKVEVLMPKLGESITEGTVVKWWKKTGDFVKKDETLLEISTDKVDSEIPSPYEGVIKELKVQENDTVEVDGVIAIIDTAGNENGVAEEQPVTEQPEVKKEPEPVQETRAATAPASGGGTLDIEMPRLGESITEGTIVKWWKKPGDQVEKDETLLEISTDKVDSEIPSPYSGTLAEVLAEENETVEVGAVIARIESAAGAAASAETTTSGKPQTAEVAKQPQQPAPAPAATTAAIPRQSGGRFYSPLVRNIARTEGVSLAELEMVPGTGVEGRVTKNDILGYLENRSVRQVGAPQSSAPVTTAKPQAPAAPAPADIAAKYAGQKVEIVQMDNIRKKIADHMVMSKSTSPHVYGVAETDFTAVTRLVKKHRAAFTEREGLKLTMNPFILYAVTRALKDFPDINSSVEGHTIIRKRFVNVGMAVATEQGLLVPTLKNADELNFVGIARNAYDLAIRARDRKLALEDIQGATFTVTNYGVFGNVIGFPIINQPNVAILGVAAVKKRPVVVESEEGDSLAIRSIAYLTLSYDHRLVDGELGDQYLQRVRHYIENFEESWM